MKKIIALFIVIAGAGGGIALGMMLRKDGSEVAGGRGGAAKSGYEGRAEETVPGNSHDERAAPDDGQGEAAKGDRDYVKIGRQIIVPVVDEGETRALMLFELAIDVPAAMTEYAYSVELRLRDAFLRELFAMSYTGAFLTTYTDERVVEELRGRLRLAARGILGDEVAEVLILDIMRQEF